MSYRLAIHRDRGGPGHVEIPGWALNISRGGLRAVVEERVELGELLDIDIAEEGVTHRGRIVWVQEEPDGQIVGLAFEERLAKPPPGVELDPSIEIAPGELAEQLDMTEEELKQAMDEAAAAGRKPAG